MFRIGKYAVLLLVAVMAFTMATAQNSEVKSLGNSDARAHESASDAYEKTVIPLTLQNISVLYENNKAWPRWSYKNNREVYSHLTEMVKRVASQREDNRTIVIEGAASPLGTDSYNNELAMRRAKVLRNILAKMEGGDKLHIHTISAGEDWKAFESFVDANYHAANRARVLHIIRCGASNGWKEKRLQTFDGGKTWRVLVNKFMGSARNAAVVHILEVTPLMSLTKDIDFCRVEPVEMLPFENPIPRVPYVPQPVEERAPVVALRTNLLVPALNFGVEVPIGNHWSLGFDYYYPWIWPKKDNRDCFEFLSWGIEARYWFGRNRTVVDRLQGHSVALYGYLGYYDFERKYRGYQGEYANVGIDYTYAMAVGKRKAVHFEFSLGVGYIYSQARKYKVVEDSGPLISEKMTKAIGFFGPTKANISLVVPIFQKIKPNDNYRDKGKSKSRGRNRKKEEVKGNE